MTYATDTTNVSASSIDLAVSKIRPIRDRQGPASNDKWPLWWSVLGVGIVCSVFWIALFRIAF